MLSAKTGCQHPFGIGVPVHERSKELKAGARTQSVKEHFYHRKSGDEIRTSTAAFFQPFMPFSLRGPHSTSDFHLMTTANTKQIKLCIGAYGASY